MLEITLSEYVPLTGGEAFHQRNQLQFWLRDKDIPEFSPVRLNSSSFWLILPQLQRHFPNQELALHLSAKRFPEFSAKP